MIAECLWLLRRGPFLSLFHFPLMQKHNSFWRLWKRFSLRLLLVFLWFLLFHFYHFCCWQRLKIYNRVLNVHIFTVRTHHMKRNLGWIIRRWLWWTFQRSCNKIPNTCHLRDLCGPLRPPERKSHFLETHDDFNIVTERGRIHFYVPSLSYYNWLNPSYTWVTECPKSELCRRLKIINVYNVCKIHTTHSRSSTRPSTLCKSSSINVNTG